MVDINSKHSTKRTAEAMATVRLGQEAFQLVQSNTIKKGDVLTVAQIAGIQASKQTSTLIPLCHQINLSNVQVSLRLDSESWSIIIVARAECEGKTGVEMEAIVAASIAACTVYDMCKAVDKGIVITEIKLLSKTGGKSGDFSI